MIHGIMQGVFKNNTSEIIQQSSNDNADFGQSVSMSISREGDIVNSLSLSVDLPELPHGFNILEKH